MTSRLLTSGALLLTIASSGYAQVIEGPPRSMERERPRVAAGTRPVESLTLMFDALIGHQDYVAPPGSRGSGDLLSSRQRGTNGAAAAALAYSRTTPRRGFDTRTEAFLNSLRDLDERVLIGGRASAGGFTDITSKMTWSYDGGVNYQPTFRLGPIALTGAEVVAPNDQTVGVSELRSLSTSASSSLSRSWNARHNTQGGYSYSRDEYLESGGVDVNTNTLMLRHSWNFNRSMGLNGAYQVSRQESTSPTFVERTRPLTTQTWTAGFDVRRRLSPSRQVSFSAGTGATRASTYDSVDYVTPSAYGNANVDLGRTWAVSASTHRTVSVLRGLTDQSFVTSDSSLWIGGGIGDRFGVALTGTYGIGRAAANQPGEYDATSAIAQLQYLIADCCSLVTSYSYYEHRIRQVSVVASAIPQDFEGSSVRVGMSITLPLHGSRTSARTGRNRLVRRGN